MTTKTSNLTDRPIIWSYGGGVQTIAILTLIAEGRLPKPELAIMADTGRERSSTLRYYKQHAEPIFEELEIPFELAGHDLATVDLYAKNGDLLIPAYTQTGKLPTFCSNEWKRFVANRRLRELGYGPKNPITIWMGMSLDEIERLKTDDPKWIHNHYPLVYDVPLRRHECLLQIERFGLPRPPKSACKICPHLNNEEWLELREDDPEDFREAVALDREVRANDKQGGVFLHSSLVPLDQVDFTVKQKPAPLFECSFSYVYNRRNVARVVSTSLSACHRRSAEGGRAAR